MTVVPGADGHVDAESIAALVDGNLAGAERDRVAGHLAECEECYEIFRDASELAGEESLTSAPRRIRQSNASRPVRWPWYAAAAALVAVLALGTWTTLVRDDSMTRLAEAASGHRELEPRLAAFAWAPLSDSTRSGSRVPSGVMAAVNYAEERAAEDPSIANRHALGVAHLLARRYEEAIAVLEPLAAEQPSSEILNDLTAALIARAEDESDAQGFAIAYETAQKSLDGGRTPAALFNRALAAEKLNLREEAIRAWDDFLSEEPDSEWAEEARRRAARLKGAADRSGEWPKERERLAQLSVPRITELALRFPQAMRIEAEEGILRRWGDATLRGSARDAERELLALDAVAAVKSRSGDRQLTAVLSLLRSSPPPLLPQLARAHVDYAAAREAYRAGALEKASSHASAALATFAPLRHPFEAQCLLTAVSVAMVRADVKATEQDLSRLKRLVPPSSRFSAARAQTCWLESLVTMGRGQAEAALPPLDESLEIFDRAGETENVAAIRNLRASAFDMLGATQRAWNERVAALPLLAPGSQKLYVTLAESGNSAERNELHALALATRRILRDIADERRDPVMKVFALTSLARTHTRLGDEPAAAAAIRDARAESAHIADDAERERLSRAIDVADATLRARSDPRAATALLDSALTTALARGFRFEIAQLLTARGRAYEAASDVMHAEEDYRAALEELERHRGEMKEKLTRSSYFEAAREPTVRLIDLLVRSGRSDEAFEIADRTRLALYAPESQASGMATVRASLLEGETLLCFASLDDRLVRWAISPRGTTVTQYALTSATLERNVQRLRKVVESGGSAAAVRRAAAFLRPLLEIRDAGAIVISGDGALRNVPWSLTPASRGDGWVIEERSLATVPGGGFLARLRSNPGEADGGNAAFVAPATPAELRDLLPPLRAAKQEIRTLQQYLPGVTVTTGAEATRERLVQTVSRADLLHFAGHAIPSVRDPVQSSLILADRAMTGADLLAAGDRLPRLAILAACETAVGREFSAGGSSGLAHLFLAGGSRTTVATSWPVSDAASSVFVELFYRELGRGTGTAEAVRRAQLAMLRSGDAALALPRSWSAFEVLGLPESTIRGTGLVPSGV